MSENMTTNLDGTFGAAIIPSAISACETSTSTLDKCLLALHDQQPSVILLNLGVNDVGFVAPWTLPNEATWKANYLAILDALHDEWPEPPIYVSKPYKTQPGGDDGIWDTMAGWIDDVIAARSAFVFHGDDERAWFQPSVGTRSTDGIHCNAGDCQSAAAAAKQTALGF